MPSTPTPSVSVVVPVYDCIDTLEECLDSLVRQTLRSIEIIVVNDGSPSDEQTIIDEYARRHPDLIVSFIKENGGLADARNFGVQRARGEYVGFVDSDDYVEPDMFESLYNAASKLNCSIAIGKYIHYGLDGKTTEQGQLDRAEDEVFPGYEFLLSQRAMVVWNKIYRRELAQRFEQPRRWFEDVAWTPVVMTHSERVCYVDRAFYHYVRRPGSIASSHDDPRTLEGIGSIHYALEHCAPVHRDAVAYMAVRRLLFESSVRPAYADRYIGAIRDLRADIVGNRLISNDVWLWNNARSYLADDYPIIPKRIVYGNFGAQALSDTRRRCVASWSQELFYGDGTIDKLDETTYDISNDPIASSLHEQQRFEELNRYCCLRRVQETGGIALDSAVLAHSFIAPCLVNGAIFAFVTPESVGMHVFGAVANHELVGEILKDYEVEIARPDGRSLQSVIHDRLVVLGAVTDGTTQRLASDVTLYGVEVFSRRINRDNLAELVIERASDVGESVEARLYPVDYVDTLVDRVSVLGDTETSLRKQLSQSSKSLARIQTSNRWRLVWRQQWMEHSVPVRLATSAWQLRKDRADAANAVRERYAAALDCPVESDLTLFESFYGRGMISNPYALFLAWSRRSDFNEYRFVWTLDDLDLHKDMIDAAQARWPNVSFVQRGTDEYMSVLARAKYLVNDVTFYFDFVKRPEQVYVNTWHSITVKSLGFDVPGNRLDQKNVVRNMLACNYFLAANDFVRDEVVLRAHLMAGLFPGEIVVEGHPRNDLTFLTRRDDVIAAIAAAGVELDPAKQTIVYAPTWRGRDLGAPSDDLEMYTDFIDQMRRAVGERYNVLVRLHQATHAQLRLRNRLRRFAVPPTIDANEMFAAVDVLITDYSSIFFDFMVTGRPIIFFTPDLDEYQRERGIYFDTDELPGPAFFDPDEVELALRDVQAISTSYADRYESVRSWACPKDDGDVSDRVLHRILDEPSRSAERWDVARPKLLLYAGNLGGGKRAARLRALVEVFGPAQFDLTVLVDDSRDGKVQWNVSALLDAGVRVVGRSRYTVFSLFENALLAWDRSVKYARAPSRLVAPAYEREWRRCLGDAKFDAVVNLDDTSVFFARLLESGKTPVKAAWREPDAVAPARDSEGWLVDRLQGRNHRFLRSIEDAIAFREDVLGGWSAG